MKLFNMYKMLCESEEFITEEMLDEVRWMSSKEEKLKNGEIPLTPSIVRRLFSKPRIVEAFHVTDLKNVFDIKKIIGKRNSISAFKYFSEDNISTARGIQTEGGVILKISGVLSIMGSSDIMSTVDPSLNRRWISAELLSPKMYYELATYFEDFNFENTAKNIKMYMTHIGMLLNKYEEEIQENLVKLVFGSNFSAGWNELLVSNVRVLSVAWLPSRAIRDYYEDEKREKYINEVIENLKRLTPNVYTFSDGEDMLKWFKENGGHIELKDFQKTEFGNYKREDLLKNITGVITLIKFDYDYLKKNFDKIKPLIYSKKDSGGYPYSELINAAGRAGHALDIFKLIFESNGRDWDNYNMIGNLIERIPDNEKNDFFLWLIKFFGEKINFSVLRQIIRECNLNKQFINDVISLYGNDSDKIIVHLISARPEVIDYIDNLNDEHLVFAIQHKPDLIKQMKNPSEVVQMAAVKQYPHLIVFIENPAENVKKYVERYIDEKGSIYERKTLIKKLLKNQLK